MQISEFHQENKLPINANKLINNVNSFKKMKFSIFHPVSSYDNDESLSETYKKTIEIAQLSEDLGFEGIFFNEGMVDNPNYKSANSRILISAISQHTNKIKLGVAITGLTIHDPRLLVEDIIMLDSLCNERLYYGLSTGHIRFKEFGIEDKSASQIFNIKLEAFNALLDGKHVNSNFDFLRMENSKISNAPEFSSILSRVFLGTTTPSKAEGIAKQGKMLAFTLKTLPSVGELNENSNFKIMEEVVDNYEKGWSDRNSFEDRPEIMINLMSHVFSKNENINEKDVIGEYLENYWRVLTGGRFPKNLHLNRCFQDGFSPMGTSDEIIKRLKKIKKTGIRWPMLCFGFGNMPFELIKQNMKTFANEIMPEFQK